MRVKLLLFFLFLHVACVQAQADSSLIKKTDALIEAYYEASYTNPDSALAILDTAEMLARKIQYPNGITSAQRQRGMFYIERSEYLRSMALLLAALTADEASGNKDGAAMDELYIGLNYFNQGKFRESMLYMDRALKIYTSIKDAPGMAMVNMNRGMVFRNTDQFEKALTCYYGVRNYYLQDDKDHGRNLSRVENNIANIYKDMKLYDKALEHYFVSKDLKIKFRDEYGLMICYSNIADVYVEQKQFNAALNYYGQAMKIAREQRSPALIKDVHFDLAHAYEMMGDMKNAYLHITESTRLRDSLVSEKYNASLAEMKVKYDTEKKEGENSILKKDNELQEVKIAEEKKKKFLFASLFGMVLIVVVLVFILYRNKQKLNMRLEEVNQKVNSQNVTLRTLNAELIESEENLNKANSAKDQLISIISHDLYNPVTSVINYSAQILERKKELSKEELGASFEKVNAAVVPLQDLLENILQWARLQKKNIAPSAEDLRLREVLDDIVKLYQPAAAFRNISIHINADSTLVVHADKLMLYFILRNLLNNAVKFCTSGKNIVIDAVKDNDHLRIKVSDEGKGFSEEVRAALNSSEIETVSEHGTGIGLSVSRKFVKAMGGKILFKNTGSGAEVEVQL
jgi:signal transduction histidine kinase/tetratricopeptide (TPR) repeat protein